MITFFKSRSVESRSKVEPATGQYIGKYRTGLDVLAQSHYRLIGSDAVEADSTTTTINATAHAALVGDAIQITSGALLQDIVFVQSITANSITLSQTLSSAPLAAVTFDILRPSIPRVGTDGTTLISATSLPLPTGAATAARQDTGNTSLGSIDVSTGELAAVVRVDSGSSDKVIGVSGSDYGGFYYQVRVDSNGFLSVSLDQSNVLVATQESRFASSAITVTAGSASSVTVITSSASMKKRIFYNDSTAVAYLKFGTTASASDFTLKLFPEGLWEELNYYGRVDAIWTSATGNMRVTTIT